MGAATKIRRSIDVEDEPWTASAKPRVSTYLCVDLCSDERFWTGLTTDLSEDDVFVATHVAVPKGTVLAVHLELPGSVRIMTLGEVRWTRSYDGSVDVPPGLGLRFIGLDDAVKGALRRFVEVRGGPPLNDRA